MQDLVLRLHNNFIEKKLTLVTAESITAGAIASAVANVSGASKILDRGFVVYNDIAKQEMLGVSEYSLSKYSAVSSQVAYEMAIGALKNSRANISVSVTGYADFSDQEDSSGLVYMGISFCKGTTGIGIFSEDKYCDIVSNSVDKSDVCTIIRKLKFEGTRNSIRNHVVINVIEFLISITK